MRTPTARTQLERLAQMANSALARSA
eukprot:COSAG06_NODE_190_length_20715_cov_51.823244_1_plen_25_part_10